MSIYLDDGDVRLYHGDALEQLALMPSESVHCIVTSPPFWGLRDYNEPRQIGLEETPDQWCTRLVTVMREARRVLRSDGVCWIEVGDTYSSSAAGNAGSPEQYAASSLHGVQTSEKYRETLAAGVGGRGSTLTPGIKSKDLVGAPWMLAFALRADGWYLRSDTIWARPNPMPESVTDRPTKSHSYVFLLTKSARYFWDADAIREEAIYGDHHAKYQGTYTRHKVEAMRESGAPNGEQYQQGLTRPAKNPHGRNARSVWSIPTEPTPFAHFATFPTALVERCIKAGTSEHGACGECGAPWRRITERGDPPAHQTPRQANIAQRIRIGRPEGLNGGQAGTTFGLTAAEMPRRETLGWEPSCECFERNGANVRCDGPDDSLPVPCVVLDPFMGSGTTALVARRLGRHAIGIELNADYLAIAAKRLEQLSLFHSTEAQSGPTTANSQESP